MEALGHIGTVTQLVGLDAGKLISLIIHYSQTVKRNRKEFQLLARDVEIIGNLLRLIVQSSETMQCSEIRRAIDELELILKEAHRLVMSCQGKRSSLVPQFLRAEDEAQKLSDVRKRISEVLLFFPLVSQVDIRHSIDELRSRTHPSDNQPQPQSQAYMSFAQPQYVDSNAHLPAAAETKETIEIQFLKNAAEAARVLSESNEKPFIGMHSDGSTWSKETDIEHAPNNGLVRKWALIRRVSVNGTVRWEDKYWEASSDWNDYKELCSHKHRCDTAGNDWGESWKESMWKADGVMHMERTAVKWGGNGKGEHWGEKWFEHYDSTGKTEKQGDEWRKLDPNTPVDVVGEAHVWHTTWRDTYDGFGGSTKSTDRWAERWEGDGGWSKWGDKWYEQFDQNGHGTRQVDTWWQGKDGYQWNRTQSEEHNGSGLVHRYGGSSGGEAWDLNVPQETCYERYPQFGFNECYHNSVHLLSVRTAAEIWSSYSQPPHR